MPMENRRYGEVRSLYINQLAHAVMEDSTMATTRANVDKKVDGFARGDLEHATEVLSALWEMANKGGDVKPPTNESSTVSLASVLPRLSCGSVHHVVRERKPRAPPTGLL
jgi:hypothetical protein